jgi:hypothetical protein
MTQATACVVMAFDEKMFEQVENCFKFLRRQLVFMPWCVHVLDLGLTEGQVKWLSSQGARVSKNLEMLPLPSGMPGYYRALTCRPLLRELIPGYSHYVWMDADIRLIDQNALAAYLARADQARESIAITQEADPTYLFVCDPRGSRFYHQKKRQRLVEVYGESMGTELGEFLCYNCGMFAMHRDSRIWDLYRKNVALALERSFGHLKEQDAMNVAIFQSGVKVASMNPVYNWLCSASEPAHHKEMKQWVRPVEPYMPISVLHLTESHSPLEVKGRMMKRIEYYRLHGLD